MILLIESVILCLLFTLMVYLMSREPIKTLYNYPPRIQERVKSLDDSPILQGPNVEKTFLNRVVVDQ